ncbi:MAG: alpha/beta fold hydrolase [Leptospiraceae bacterium]|nr:alpha/beta fold hydrolase [Leptospiraceae bacterium]
MTAFWFFLILMIVFFAVAHFGLPEKQLPPPPQPGADGIMQGAEPWRFEGESGIAFLVCHGYGGSPFNTRPLGEFLNSLGHTAIGLRMPGHGTNIDDLARTRFYHWEEYVERIYLEERSRYRKLFLVGFSFGGTVSLKVAAKNADSFRPAGIITISTPVFFNGFFNGKFILHQVGTIFTGILKIIQPVLKFDRERPLSTERLNPWVGYRYTHAVAALHSFKQALPAVRRGLPRITVPYCSIMAANDRTVSPENQIYIYNNIHSREKRAYMFILPPDLTTMHSLLTHERAKDRVFRYVETFIKETLEETEHNRTDAKKLRHRRFWQRPTRATRSPEDLTV